MKILQDNIITDPTIKGGKPVIKGTRVPVDLVIGKLAGGATAKEVRREYDLTDEQIQNALKYASAIDNMIAEARAEYMLGKSKTFTSIEAFIKELRS